MNQQLHIWYVKVTQTLVDIGYGDTSSLQKKSFCANYTRLCHMIRHSKPMQIGMFCNATSMPYACHDYVNLNITMVCRSHMTPIAHALPINACLVLITLSAGNECSHKVFMSTTAIVCLNVHLEGIYCVCILHSYNAPSMCIDECIVMGIALIFNFRCVIFQYMCMWTIFHVYIMQHHACHKAWYSYHMHVIRCGMWAY